MQSFVSPEFCISLVAAGLNALTGFTWQFEKGSTYLNTFYFDQDNIYRQAFENMHFIQGKPTQVVAFQMADMECLLPNYLLTNTNGQYELMCEALFGMCQQKGSRLPDVFAAMILKGLQSYKINVENATNFLHTKILQTSK